jgi:hypothetical protein
VTGLLAVVAGDVAIAIAAVLGIIYTSRGRRQQPKSPPY